MSDLDNILFDLAYQQGKSVSECLYDVYNKGRADGYSQAENDYFAQSQKDREDTYNCGYAIGRADERTRVIDFILANVRLDCEDCELIGNCGCDCKQTLLKKLEEQKNE